MEAEELHQVTHTHLQTKLFADLLGSFVRYAGDLRKPFRLPFHNHQGLISKTIDNAVCHFRADALDHPAGQIGDDFCGRLGHQPFQEFRFKLPPVAGMGAPFAGDHQPLAHHRQGNGTHHGDGLLVLQPQAQHGIAVVVVLKDNGFNIAL